jgi:hypothetical protein
MKTTEVANQLTVEEIVEKRNQVFSLFDHGVTSINKALLVSKEIQEHGAYLRGWQNVDPVLFKKEYDRKIWRYLFELSGTSHLMNADQKAEFELSMETNVPEITVSTINATLFAAKMERGETFIKGLIGVLQGVCSSYKSNKSFKINKKLVFSGVNGWGQWADTMKNRMVDIERMIHIANKERPPTIGLRHSIYKMSGKPQTKEFKYFSVRTFKNGNAHMTIKCAGTLNKLNNMIADYYDGSALAN